MKQNGSTPQKSAEGTVKLIPEEGEFNLRAEMRECFVTTSSHAQLMFRSFQLLELSAMNLVHPQFCWALYTALHTYGC